MDFSYWNAQTPETFLQDDWNSEARAWAGQRVREAVATGTRTMVEVGPGSGVDYELQFRALVRAGTITYRAIEGSERMAGSLRRRFPEIAVETADLVTLAPQSCDLLYAKAVLEHQPALEPAFSTLLRAARRVVLLNWYRPPAVQAESSELNGVHYRTYALDDVLRAIDQEGWRLRASWKFTSNGNLCWELVRDAGA